MARRLRFAPPGYWLHITQRGNNQQKIFTSDADRHHFLSLVENRSEERDVRIAAYALMPNHFHLVAIGDRDEAISRFMMDVNGQYAMYRNAIHRTSGHLWQGRFYSCVLDTPHWETALRYVESNPVRARMVKTAADFRWSSARAHLGLEPAPEWLDTADFDGRWPTPAHWADQLTTLTRREAATIRRATRHELPLGSDDFIRGLEEAFARPLRPKPPGRALKPVALQAMAGAG